MIVVGDLLYDLSIFRIARQDIGVFGSRVGVLGIGFGCGSRPQTLLESIGQMLHFVKPLMMFLAVKLASYAGLKMD